jgi:soluble lytic murein transglycosylase-like protein
MLKFFRQPSAGFIKMMKIKMVLSFTIAALPFIILPFLIVSNGEGTGGGPVAFAMAVKTAQEEMHPMSASRGSSQKILQRAQIGYDVSVLRAMREMNLVFDHFDSWMEQHPGTALSSVMFMPAAMQRDVASTALFIKKANNRIDAKTAWREAAALVHYSAKYGVPAVLSTAVAHVESTFDPDALSPKGASGVMQVMWKLHERLLSSNGIHATSTKNPLSDPERAIAAGCLLLSRYIKTYGSLRAAIDRYYGCSSASYQRKVNRNIADIVNHRAKLVL